MIADVLVARKNYPYVNARVRARRGDLITDPEYRKLMNMELSGIAEFLGNRGYGPEIEQLGRKHSGEELVEKAVRANLARTYRELMGMAPDPVQELLALYFRKLDIENAKMLLRATVHGGDVAGMLVPTREMDAAELERLEAMETPQEIMDAFELDGFDTDLEDYLPDDDDLAAVEDALDIFYYTELVERIDDIGGRSELFKQFLELEALLKNVSLVLRMKRRGHSYADIRERLIPVPARHGIDPVDLASLEDVDAVLDHLADTPVGEFLDEESPAEVQRALEQYKLRQGVRLLHEDQLGVNPVLGYMVCKEVEAKNLRMLARAKADGLETAFMKRNLVTGVAS